MKTSKEVSQNSCQEDCGVWLDTVKLKGINKKRHSARPISKLLNPFADGGGYNVAVALNFTQTKIEMPKTKQSSISNYFTGQRRVLNKMSTAGEPKADVQGGCFTTAFLVAKSTPEDSCKVDYKKRNDHLSEPLMWWEKDEESHAPSENINSDCEEKSSVDKKSLMRTFDAAFPADKCDGPELKTQCQKRFQKSSEINYRRSLLSQNKLNAFEERLVNAEGRASAHKTSKGLSQQNDKENTIHKSTSKAMFDSRSQSFIKNMKPQPLNLNKEFSSPIKWTKSLSSPLKKQKWQSSKDSDDESLSMLFTQDSQGFRVIAHRGSQTQSPLKDQSNLRSLGPSEVKFLEENKDEEEMLFTQDSQGNIVIKH